MDKKKLLGLENKKIAFDLDLTLTANTVEDYMGLPINEQIPLYEELEPNMEMIELFNQLAEKNTVFVYTARNDLLQGATYRWLNKHGVKYDYFVMSKAGYDVFIDDKAWNVEDIK